jgi:hypothetical protein
MRQLHGLHGGAYPLRDIGAQLGGDAGKQNGEFLAAEARDQVGGAA